MSDGTRAEFDATNSVRLCDSCELEQGASAGADAGDRACAACGQHRAPNIYVGLAEHDRLRLALERIAATEFVGGSNLRGLAREALAGDSDA